MIVIIPISDNYTRQETWDKTDLYCPECGMQSIWVDPGSTDYDSGEDEHLCTSCKKCGYGLGCWSDCIKDDLYVIDCLLHPDKKMPIHNPKPPICRSPMEIELLRKIENVMFSSTFGLKPKKMGGLLLRFEDGRK